mmetsp:Transcript_8645/g.22336  ORF Transcript_8645/g.22336 Transcript_8645/m.22336 type:complete len:372 (-) Transcript_8645:181-1296(-)
MVLLLLVAAVVFAGTLAVLNKDILALFSSSGAASRFGKRADSSVGPLSLGVEPVLGKEAVQLGVALADPKGRRAGTVPNCQRQLAEVARAQPERLAVGLIQRIHTIHIAHEMDAVLDPEQVAQLVDHQVEGPPQKQPGMLRPQPPASRVPREPWTETRKRENARAEYRRRLAKDKVEVIVGIQVVHGEAQHGKGVRRLRLDRVEVVMEISRQQLPPPHLAGTAGPRPSPDAVLGPVGKHHTWHAEPQRHKVGQDGEVWGRGLPLRIGRLAPGQPDQVDRAAAGRGEPQLGSGGPWPAPQHAHLLAVLTEGLALAVDLARPCQPVIGAGRRQHCVPLQIGREARRIVGGIGVASNSVLGLAAHCDRASTGLQ